MLILALVVVGAFSYFTLGVDLFPKVDIPTVSVIVADRGASPEEIETEITKKVEDAVNTISQVDEVRSTSSEGQSLVVITFELAKNGNVAAQEVQNKVNLIANNLPQTAKTPVVQKFDPDATPILQVAVSAPRSLRDVTLIADKQIKQKLENAKGVGQITIVGGARREIHVLVDPDRLRAYNLTVSDVFNALRQQNLELPGGNLNAGAREFTIRTSGKVLNLAQFNRIPVATREGYVVTVSDIGFAEDSYEEPRTSARLDGVAAVTLVVAKQSGENSVSTASEVKQRLREIRLSLPPDVKTQVIGDQSVFIEAAVGSIKKHLVEGSIFASIIIFIFLANWRTTLIAAIAIPTSIIATFALMAAMGFTLNQITMLALTLMVGIVIDDAIIVLENIYRFIEEKGMTPFEAAIEGTREIGLAVMATTLSLLAVFLPVGFMGGIVGRFMSSFGFTSGFSIAVSLLVSFTLTPMLCSRFIRAPKRLAVQDQAEVHRQSKDSGFFRLLDRGYTRMLVWSMGHRKTVIALSGLTMVSIVPLFMLVNKNFLPADDTSQFNVLIRAPEGTSLAATTQIAERVAQQVRALPGVENTLMTVGRSADASVNNASLYVKLTTLDQRTLSQQDLMQRTRALLRGLPSDLHTGVELVSSIGGNQSNAEVQYFIQGPDLEKLSKYSDALLAKMKQIPGVTDADSTLRTGKPELKLDIDRARAADLGVSVQDIEQALNTLVAGQVASTFNAGEDQYDVRVRAQEQFRGSVEGLSKITVSSSKKRSSVGLDEVVRIHSGAGPSSVNRIARQRQVTVTCNVLPGGSQAAILADLDRAAGEIGMEAGYRTGLSGASKELNRTGGYFILAFSLTFIFMYIVLAAQFESFIHPITILLTLPLAVPFGILSLLVAGQSVNIFSGLGLLLLFGIVKKNAILQIDLTNRLRATGMPRYEAIIQANRDRLRPILMTTMALVAGMLPLVISSGTGAATNRSIGVLVVGGQSLCLILTLLAVPVFYSAFEDLVHIPRRLLRPVLAMLSMFSCFTLFGQNPAPPPLPALAPQVVPARIGIVGEQKLTLQEAIGKVLANDRDLVVYRIATEEAVLNLAGAKGYYDPVFNLSAYRVKTVTPVASLLGGAANGKVTTRQLYADPEVAGEFPWLGGSYRFHFASSRQSTDSTFNTLNPQFPSAATLNLTQPLWRGLRFDQNRYRIQVARSNIELTDQQLRQRVIEVVTQAIEAYWELDFAYRNLSVQIEAVRLAEQQDQSNRRQVDQGVLAPVDVIQTQTQVATFQQNVFTAQETVTRAENSLKALLLPSRADPTWGIGLIPVTPINGRPVVPDLSTIVKEALANRPELAESRVGLDQNRLATRLNAEQARPQINAVATLSAQGLSGRPVTVIPNPILAQFGLGNGVLPAIFPGGYSQSLNNLVTGQFPSAQIGVQMSIPIRNRTALAQLSLGLAEQRRLTTLQQSIEIAIEADIRNSLQGLSTAGARLDSAEAARKFAEEQYSSEQRQFQAGTSSVFLVLQRQTELISARSREIRASADVGRAAADVDRASARTLQTNNIQLQNLRKP